MAAKLDERILASWATSCRLTAFLLERLPEELWDRRVPEIPRKTIRMIAGHLHNNRCRWIGLVGEELGVEAPPKVDRRSVTRAELMTALEASGEAMAEVLRRILERGGEVPDFPWRNLPRDVVHFLTYHGAHEAHHRGQIVMVARQLGERLPREVTNGLWQWTRRVAEASQSG